MDERQQLAKNLLDDLASGDPDAAAAAIEQYATFASSDFDHFVDRAEEVFSAWPDRGRPFLTICAQTDFHAVRRLAVALLGRLGSDEQHAAFLARIAEEDPHELVVETAARAKWQLSRRLAIGYEHPRPQRLEGQATAGNAKAAQEPPNSAGMWRRVARRPARARRWAGHGRSYTTDADGILHREGQADGDAAAHCDRGCRGDTVPVPP